MKNIAVLMQWGGVTVNRIPVELVKGVILNFPVNKAVPGSGGTLIYCLFPDVFFR